MTESSLQFDGDPRARLERPSGRGLRGVGVLSFAVLAATSLILSPDIEGPVAPGDGSAFMGLGAGVLHAGTGSADDLDGDGLPNTVEAVLETNEYYPDSDLDGYEDMEEFARGSDPMDADSVPLPGSLGLAMSATGEQDGLHLQIFTYSTHGDVQNYLYQVGLMADGEVRLLPDLLNQVQVTVSRGESAAAGADVLMMDFPFPESAVHLLGDISVFSTLTLSGSQVIDAAAGIDLTSTDGIVLLARPGPNDRWAAYHAQQTGGSGGSTGPQGGSIYMPIPTGGGSVPNTWTPGEICYQATIQVGAENGVIFHEIIGADCITGWDAHCKTDCDNSIGDVFQTFDPLGLVGG